MRGMVPVRIALILLGGAVAAGCATAPTRLESLTIDYPHGELRLLVRRNGEARLFFGALPRSVAVRRGVFRLDALERRLRPSLHDVVPAQQRPLFPYGMVTIAFTRGGQASHLIYDRAVAREILAKACVNRTDHAAEPEPVFVKACEAVTRPSE